MLHTYIQCISDSPVEACQLVVSNLGHSAYVIKSEPLKKRKFAQLPPALYVLARNTPIRYPLITPTNCIKVSSSPDLSGFLV